MSFFETVITGVISLFLSALGFSINSLRTRVINVEQELHKKVTKEELSELIDLKQEVLKQMAKDTREDIVRLNDKIDKLIDRK